MEIGKQLLMTRGVLTTFSIANDVAKYFAIIPAMFSAVAGLSVLKRKRTRSPTLQSGRLRSSQMFIYG